MQRVAKGCHLGLQSLSPVASPARLMARRRMALAANKLFRKEMTFERNGFKWTGLTTCSITREIFLNDHYQDANLNDLLGRVAAGPTGGRPIIVNVGANLGDLALPLARSGKRVIAVEPNPATFARLEHNVRQNGMTQQVTCCAAAIATTHGTAELVVPADPGNSELSAGGDKLGFDGVDRRQNVVQVRTVPLEDLLRSLNIQPAEVALVCSDTQGFETQIIASGGALWASGTPLWVEVWPQGLACHGGVQQFLDACQQHFRQMLPAEQILGEPQPVSDLAGIVASLKGADFTDVLLIP